MDVSQWKYIDIYAINKGHFTVSTGAHLRCVPIQFEVFNFIVSIITITYVTRLIFCG